MTSEAITGDGGEEIAADEDRLRFHYLKSNFFRSVHVDGLIGGITPRLTIVMGFYSERHPYPDQIAHAINPNGTLGDELLEERIARDGLVRELEVNTVMSIDVAKAVINWLTQQVNMVEQGIKEARARQRAQAEGAEAGEE